jgi:hypothetical protein
MQKRMSINPELIKGYSNPIRIDNKNNTEVNGESDSDSEKNLKPTDSTKVKRM